MKIKMIKNLMMRRVTIALLMRKVSERDQDQSLNTAIKLHDKDFGTKINSISIMKLNLVVVTRGISKMENGKVTGQRNFQIEEVSSMVSGKMEGAMATELKYLIKKEKCIVENS